MLPYLHTLLNLHRLPGSLSGACLKKKKKNLEQGFLDLRLGEAARLLFQRIVHTHEGSHTCEGCLPHINARLTTK